MQNADMQQMLESVAQLPPIDTEIIYGSCLRHESIPIPMLQRVVAESSKF